MSAQGSGWSSPRGRAQAAARLQSALPRYTADQVVVLLGLFTTPMVVGELGTTLGVTDEQVNDAVAGLVVDELVEVVTAAQGPRVRLTRKGREQIRRAFGISGI